MKKRFESDPEVAQLLAGDDVSDSIDRQHDPIWNEGLYKKLQDKAFVAEIEQAFTQYKLKLLSEIASQQDYQEFTNTEAYKKYLEEVQALNDGLDADDKVIGNFFMVCAQNPSLNGYATKLMDLRKCLNLLAYFKVFSSKTPEQIREIEANKHESQHLRNQVIQFETAFKALRLELTVNRETGRETAAVKIPSLYVRQDIPWMERELERQPRTMRDPETGGPLGPKKPWYKRALNYIAKNPVKVILGAIGGIVLLGAVAGVAAYIGIPLLFVVATAGVVAVAVTAIAATVATIKANTGKANTEQEHLLPSEENVATERNSQKLSGKKVKHVQALDDFDVEAGESENVQPIQETTVRKNLKMFLNLIAMRRIPVNSSISDEAIVNLIKDTLNFLPRNKQNNKVDYQKLVESYEPRRELRQLDLTVVSTFCMLKRVDITKFIDLPSLLAETLRGSRRVGIENAEKELRALLNNPGQAISIAGVAKSYFAELKQKNYAAAEKILHLFGSLYPQESVNLNQHVKSMRDSLREVILQASVQKDLRNTMASSNDRELCEYFDHIVSANLGKDLASICLESQRDLPASAFNLDFIKEFVPNQSARFKRAEFIDFLQQKEALIPNQPMITAINLFLKILDPKFQIKDVKNPLAWNVLKENFYAELSKMDAVKVHKTLVQLGFCRYIGFNGIGLRHLVQKFYQLENLEKFSEFKALEQPKENNEFKQKHLALFIENVRRFCIEVTNAKGDEAAEYSTQPADLLINSFNDIIKTVGVAKLKVAYEALSSSVSEDDKAILSMMLLYLSTNDKTKYKALVGSSPTSSPRNGSPIHAGELAARQNAAPDTSPALTALPVVVVGGKN